MSVALDVLPRSEWASLAATHERRVDPYVRPHLKRRRTGVKHPVFDFLFSYYSYPVGKLRAWHPGYGTALADAGDRGRGYEEVGGVVRVAASYVTSQHPLISRIRELLVATAGRPPSYGCFGLHEWAMVYRADETRHAWPLRLGARGTDDVVEQSRITCSHFDAYRFFTPEAAGLNTLRPGAADRPAYEQPGCLHATMDLYKHAFRMAPMTPSDLVFAAFELAWDVRVVDMRAAPYDLRDLGLAPIPIERAAGRREYVDLQRGFTDRAAPIRAELIGWCDRLLAV